MAKKTAIIRALPGVTYFVAGLLVLIELSLLLPPSAVMAFPVHRIQRGEGIALNGKVVAIEHGDYLTALIIRSGGIGRPPNDRMKFFISLNTTIKACNVNGRVENIRIGDAVTITYHKTRGLAIADIIVRQC